MTASFAPCRVRQQPRSSAGPRWVIVLSRGTQHPHSSLANACGHIPILFGRNKDSCVEFANELSAYYAAVDFSCAHIAAYIKWGICMKQEHK